jgi:phosphoribosylaminoimidazole (AIR) synthetase
VEDMFGTFNMGLGMILVSSPDAADEALEAAGHDAYRVGSVAAGGGVRLV